MSGGLLRPGREGRSHSLGERTKPLLQNLRTWDLRRDPTGFVGVTEEQDVCVKQTKKSNQGSPANTFPLSAPASLALEMDGWMDCVSRLL